MRLMSGVCGPALLLLLSLLLCCVPTTASSQEAAPDSTGLVGTPYVYEARAAAGSALHGTQGRAGSLLPLQLPFKLWGNHRESAIKPRKRDRSPHELMQLMGSDFDPRWMRRTRREDKLLNATSWVETRAADGDEERRPSLQALWESALALQPPSSWPSPPPTLASGSPALNPSSGSPAAWLVALGSCPARSQWRDLGLYFWPRFVRRVECVPSSSSSTQQPNSRRGKAGPAPIGCGWPPGRLTCGPGVTKTLYLLRWHCRLRSNSSETWARLAGVLSPGKAPPQPQRKRRKRYLCEWLKVPFPVPSDCQCGGH